MATTAREEIFARIREANSLAGQADAPTNGQFPTPQGHGWASRDELLDRFVEVTADYRADVIRCSAAELPDRIREGLASRDARSVVVADGLNRTWLSGFDGEVVIDDNLSAEQLDQIDAVVTGSSVGIADTGTIVLDHTGDQGRRAISLVPDLHVCVIREDQVVGSVPESVERLAESASARHPLTWISGPSATSDIELNRVEGVHGPRHLWVIVVSES